MILTPAVSASRAALKRLKVRIDPPPLAVPSGGLSTIPDRLPRDSQPLRGLVLFLTGLLLTYLLAALTSSLELATVANAVGPAVLGLACMFVAYQMVNVNRLIIWTPIPWFLAASALYFGFGPLVCIFGDEATIGDLDIAWPMDASMLLRTNVLNTVGILVISLFLAGIDFKNPMPIEKVSDSYIGDARMACLIFLCIGIPVKYLLVLPYEFGLLTFVLPGAVGGLVALAPLGVMMLAFLSVRRGQPWTTVLLCVLAFEVPVDFLRFSKIDILLGIILAGLGRYLGTQRLRDLVALAVILIPVYFLLCPIVLLCRSEIVRRNGDVSAARVYKNASLSERADVFWTTMESWGVRESELEYVQRTGTQRCCYANVQAFCMHAYDTGSPGDTLESFLIALIPRFLWPDKPDLTEVGENFTELVFGNRNSSTGMGVFGEAYWNGGWGMVVFACACIGLVLAWMSRMALELMYQNKWMFLPCLFLGMKIGFRIDGWILIDYVGPTLIVTGYLTIIVLLAKITARKEVRAHGG